MSPGAVHPIGASSRSEDRPISAGRRSGIRPAEWTGAIGDHPEILFDERRERPPETLQVAPFDLDRSAILVQHLEELPSERYHPSLLVGGLEDIELLERILR